MKYVLSMLVLLSLAMGTAIAADAGGAQKKTIPYRLIPLEKLAVTVKKWSNEADPHYAIITNVGEWNLNFAPAATMNAKPSQPEPSFFKREQLLAISRVSDAPAQGGKVLFMKSLVQVDGEIVLTYGFLPPANKAGFKMINTILLAIPNEYPLENGIRIVEDVETPESMATAAGIEAARAAGRIKPPAR